MHKPPAGDEDDDGTIIVPPGARRGVPGDGADGGPTLRPGSGPVVGNALPIGTRIGEYELVRIVGEGGFGIVYAAHDHALERTVAIKEYMPAELAERASDLRVVCASDDDRPLFERGMRSFVNEARLLARFDHPSLLKVYRFWEGNGSACMVMPLYEGPTLLDELRRRRGAVDEAWLRRLLDPLTHALAVIHDADVFHRDIAPDNIVLLAGSGRPVLLDFGAARRVIADAAQKAPTAIVKPGYAPIEQYSDVNLKQGPWSDVYALAAVMHYAITGDKPPAAIARLAGDAYVPLATRLAGRYGTQLLAALDRALAVRPDERTCDMAALRADLGLAPLVRDRAGRWVLPEAAPAPPAPAPPRKVARDDDATIIRRPTVPPQVDADATRLPESVTPPPAARAPTAAVANANAAAPPVPGRRRRVGVAAALAVGAAVAIGAGAWWLWGSMQAAPPPVATSDGGQPAPPVPRSETAPPPLTEAPPAARPAPPPAPPPARSSLAPFDVADQFDRIESQSAPGHSVSVQWKSRGVFGIASGDLLAMNITSSHDGYLYVFAHTPDGVLLQYFPNALSKDNFVRRQTVHPVPRSVVDPTTREVHAGLALTEPAGQGHLLALVSRYPRDFALLGDRRETIYPRYPTGPEAALLDLQLGGSRSIYLGTPRCPEGKPCEDRFWATAVPFTIVP